MIVIGIDPDLVKSGVAVVEKGRVVDLHSPDLFDLMDMAMEWKALGAHFVIEDVESMRPTFPRALKGGSRVAQIAKISQNVGQVKAIARVLRAYMDRIGADYTMCKPLGGTAKAAKRNADLFRNLTGWTGRSNEDTRDAAMLALYGWKKKCAKRS